MKNTDLSNLAPPEGAVKKKKRVGRGQGSTLGKTAGKGQKGQKARSGGKVPLGFEGGQMPLHRRLPKVGFTPPNQKIVATVNLDDLDKRFTDGQCVDLESLKACGLIRSNSTLVKVLGRGEITKALQVNVTKISASAKEKVEAAGGSVEVQ